MKQLAMMSLTVIVFLVYKLVGSDATNFGFGVFGFVLATFVALVCWLAVARVGKWLTLMQQGLLFTVLDAAWRGVSYLRRAADPAIVLLDGAPIGYFVVVYGMQAVAVFVLLCLLQSVPPILDKWLCLPQWMKAKFGGDLDGSIQN
ncbi:MAG: hypothetical protein ACKVOO_12800 [Burkholderiaceae bacterium]